MKKRELKKIYDFKNNRFKVSSISDKDFRGTDLSDISKYEWGGVQLTNCIFDDTEEEIAVDGKTIENCSFKGCAVYIINSSWRGKSIFKNCDLSESDIYVYSSTNVEFLNCKLPNILKTLFMQANYIKVDIDSLKKSPGVRVASKNLPEIIKFSIKGPLEDLEIIEAKNKELIDFIKEKDADSHYYKLVEVLNKTLNSYQLHVFFAHNVVYNATFDGVDFGYLDSNALKTTAFLNCTFRNCTFKAPIKKLIDGSTPVFRDCNFENNIFEGLNYQTFMDIDNNRFLGSPITFRKNLYVELGRLCNAKCTFCRNNSFDGCKFDIEKVLETLKEATNNYSIDDVVFGGGEPTLFPEEIYRAYAATENTNDIYIFTNGTADLKFYETWLDTHYSNGLNISRHAVSDEENAAILGVKDEKSVSIDKIKSLLNNSNRKITLCATCFKGALDTKEKIIRYLVFAQNQGFERVLLSTLHKDSSSGENTSFDDINIDDSIFPEVIKILQDFGFSVNSPIYSNGGYISTSLETSGFTVVLKQYITKKELDEKWKLANKRTIDLSIDPSGVLYGNWHQRDDGIIVPEEKPMSLRMK